MSINPLFAHAAKQNEGYNGEYDDIDTSSEALIKANETVSDNNNTISDEEIN